MNITLQQQPTWNSCVSACVAMILNKPVDEVVSEFHEDYYAGKLDPDEYLTKSGVNCEVLLTNAKLEMGHIYICSVPSLNKQALTHAILIDMRDECWSLFDPNMGKEGKLYYVPNFPDEEVEGNEVKLITAAPDIRITL